MSDYISREAALQFQLTANLRPEKLTAVQAVADAIAAYIKSIPPADVRPVEEGEWIVRQRNEHYPSCRPYEELICPFCKRTDHNGDGRFCGYCGAKMGGADG